jgi:hypothetical protein
VDIIPPKVLDIELDSVNIVNDEDFRGTATILDEESGLYSYAITNSDTEPERWNYLDESTKEKQIAFDVILENQGTHFDPNLVDAFVRIEDELRELYDIDETTGLSRDDSVTNIEKKNYNVGEDKELENESDKDEQE